MTEYDTITQDKDRLIEIMLDAPLSLSDNEVDTITHDGELREIYEMSAALTSAYACAPAMDTAKEWEQFQPRLTKKSIIPHLGIKAAAILAGTLLVSSLIYFLMPKASQDQEIISSYIPASTNESTAPTSISETLTLNTTTGSQPHILPAIQPIYETDHKILTDPIDDDWAIRICGPGQPGRKSKLPLEYQHNNVRFTHPAISRSLYWFNLKVQKSDEEFLSTYISSMDSLDISIVPPKGFESCTFSQGLVVFDPNPQYKRMHRAMEIGFDCLGPAFESKNKEAVIFYPMNIDYPDHTIEEIIEMELTSVNNGNQVDIDKSVKLVDDHGHTNADRIMRYEYDIPGQLSFHGDQRDTILNKHRHCVALALKKENHYSLPLKIFLNDEGLKHKDEYIDIALQSVRFGNEAPTPIYSAEQLFDLYRNDLSNLDTKISVPEGLEIKELRFLDSFVETKPYYFFKYGLPYRRAGWWYPLALESEPLDGAILLPLAVGLNSFGANIEDEIIASMDDPELDVTDRIKIVTGEEANRITNADTIAIYHVELAEPVLDRYKHCMGVYLKKENHPSWLMKIVTTEAGKANEEILLDKLLHSIRFGDKIVETEYDATPYDLTFPKKELYLRDTNDILIR